MQDNTGQLEAAFFDAQRDFQGFKVRRGGAQKIKLQNEVDRELKKIAAAEKRLKVLRRVGRGDYRDRAIYVDAIWEAKGRKIVGAALAVFKDSVNAYPDVCESPHELYGAAILSAWRKVIKQTGGWAGLTINFAKAPDPETMRLLTDPGAWGDYFNCNGGQRDDLAMWMAISGSFRDGEVRYRQAPLLKPNSERLAYMADRACHLSGSIESLSPEAFDRIFNKPLRENPPTWFLSEHHEAPSTPRTAGETFDQATAPTLGALLKRFPTLRPSRVA